MLHGDCGGKSCVRPVEGMPVFHGDCRGKRSVRLVQGLPEFSMATVEGRTTYVRQVQGSPGVEFPVKVKVKSDAPFLHKFCRF